MPLLKSNYHPSYFFRNYHISTIYTSVFRKVKGVNQQRERLELQDGDFLDLDWSYSPNKNSDKVLIVLHGLEGNSQRPYMTGLAKLFNKNGWDVAAVNFRGCSGEMNRLYRSYNAGASEDLKEVISAIILKEKYSRVALNGFSLGGNVVLKYLGEGNELPKELIAAVTVSTPIDLAGSCEKLAESKNSLYSKRFVKKLKEQLYLREDKFPEDLDRANIDSCHSLVAIDDLYTSKAHGFEDAADYYSKSSALNFIDNIKIPTLLINAKNDEFLSDSCYPIALAKKKSNFYLEIPDYGGHVGFLQKKEHTYSEERALEFIKSYI